MKDDSKLMFWWTLSVVVSVIFLVVSGYIIMMLRSKIKEIKLMTQHTQQEIASQRILLGNLLQKMD